MRWSRSQYHHHGWVTAVGGDGRRYNHRKTQILGMLFLIPGRLRCFLLVLLRYPIHVSILAQVLTRTPYLLHAHTSVTSDGHKSEAQSS
jgi:hypothetical protein